MKPEPHLAKRRRSNRTTITGVVLVAASIAAYSYISSRPLRWTEEVKLHSGEVITVKRTAKLKANFIAGGGGGSFNEGMTVEIVAPLKADNPAPWSARFVPLVFDRDEETKEWFMVATFFHCDSWIELGRPKLPYTEYRFKDGRWVQQALSPRLLGREANMFTGMGPQGVKHLTVVQKAERFREHPSWSKFKTIVNDWHTGC